MNVQSNSSRPSIANRANYRRARLTAAVAAACGLALTLAAPTSRAATITWGAPTVISGDANVSTTGTTVGAFNLGGTGVTSSTINTVTFNAFAVPGGTSASSGNFTLSVPSGALGGANGLTAAAAPFNTLSASYQNLLSSLGGSTTVAPLTLAMSGLNVGDSYQFEWWYNLSIASGFSFNDTATAGNSVTLNDNTTQASGGVGQFAIGTFFADATTQNILFNSVSSNGLNGFQLRNITPTAAFWTGDQGSVWTTNTAGNTNWATTLAGATDTGLLPGSVTDVTFSATNVTGGSQNTTLGADFTIHSLTIQDTAAVTIGGANTLTIAGAAGTGIDVQAGAGLFTMDANLTFGGSSDTITVNNTAGAVIHGVIDGTNGLFKEGTGTLTLTGTNTYTGGTHVNGGVLEINNDQALGTSGVGVNTFLADGTELRGIATFTLTHTILFPTGAGTSATLSAAAGTVLTVSDLSMQGSGKAIFGSTGNTGVVAVAPTINFSAVSPTASIEVAFGTLRNAGGLNFFTDGLTGVASTTVDLGATLDTNGFGTTIRNLQGAGTLTNDGATAATFTINSGAFSGAIQDGVSATAIIKNGPGTLALTGDNTFSGSFTVNDGTVQIQSASGAITGDSLIIGDGVGGHTAVVQTTSSFNNIFNNATFDYTTVVTIDNNGTLDLNGFHESIGSIASAAGVAAGSGLGTIGLGAGGFLNVGVNNASTTFNGTITGTGAGIVTKLGTGAWTLTSASTYTGSTNINAGALLANNTTGSATGTSTVAINTGGTLGGSGTAGGAVTLNNGGFIAPGASATGISTATLTANSLTWNGGGQLNSQLGTTSDLLALTGALTKGTAGTFGVEITDAGGILSQTHYQLATFVGSTFATSDFTLAPTSLAGLNGFFTLTGTELDYDITGVSVSGSIIQNTAPVGTPALADFTVVGVGTTGAPNENNTIHTLTFAPGASLTIHNLLQVTLGPVILPGGSTITLDGSLSVSQLQMLLGSLLNGNGNIYGDLINAGLVSPGHSPGQIHVSGNYIQTPTGTLRIEVGGRDLSQHDLLSVGGTATLDGTLQLVRLNHFKLKRNKPVTFLTANGGVSGRFSIVESGFTSDTILQPTVVYHANSVALEAKQGSFETFADKWGLTRNQKSVAQALDSVAFNKKANSLIDYLDYRKLDKLPGDFDKIAPEELTSIFTIGVSLANVQSQNIQRHTDDIRSGTSGFSAAGLAVNGAGPSYSGSFNLASGVAGPNGNGGKDDLIVSDYKSQDWGVFLSGTGEWVSVGNTDNARGYDLSSGGFTLGIDYKVTPNFAIGLAAGYTGTSADLVDRGRVYVNGGKIGLYATFFQNQQAAVAAPTMSKDSSKEAPTPTASIAKGFYADVAVFGGYNSYDTRRSALQGEARGDTDGGELNALFGMGYDIKKGNLTFGPTASFNYTYIGTSDFTEHGSLAPLNIHGGKGESLRTALGLKASYDWKVGGILIKPEIRAAWQHEYGDAAYALDSSFANGAGNSFLVNGPELGRDSVLLGAGFAIQCSERCSTYFYYDGELGRKNYQSTSVTGGFRYAF